MRPRRDLFAAGYIDETVVELEREFVGSGDDNPAENPETAWAVDVLNEYFRITPQHPSTDVARDRFAQLVEAHGIHPTSLTPYQRQLDASPPVQFDDFMALSVQRRSVRWFKDEPVPRELIDKAMLAAGQAPTACNRQPFQFRFFDEPELREKVSRVPMGTKGYRANIPTFCVLVGHLENFSEERDRHLIYIDASLAAMSFAYAVETLGLSTCMINWPDIPSREKTMQQLLNLEPFERPVMCMAIGYPDETALVPRSVKKPLDLLRRFN